MSETVINLVALAVIIAAVIVGVFSPLFALLAALWQWYREAGNSVAAPQPTTPHAREARGCD